MLQDSSQLICCITQWNVIPQIEMSANFFGCIYYLALMAHLQISCLQKTRVVDFATPMIYFVFTTIVMRTVHCSKKICLNKLEHIGALESTLVKFTRLHTPSAEKAHTCSWAWYYSQYYKQTEMRVIFHLSKLCFFVKDHDLVLQSGKPCIGGGVVLTI